MPADSGDGPAAHSRRGLLGHVANAIGLRIVTGNLPPGSVLPNEATLGAELAVSRTVLREAIKVLGAKGLVEARPRTGTRVLPRNRWNMLDPDVLAWQVAGRSGRRFAEDLLEVRRIIEPAAAALAAERARPADIAAMADAFRDMERVSDDLRASIEPDIRFHTAILSATGNELLLPLGALIGTALAATFRLTTLRPGAVGESLPWHRAVLDAIRCGDAAGASAAMGFLLARTHDDNYDIAGDCAHEDGAHEDGAHDTSAHDGSMAGRAGEPARTGRTGT